ncbi:DNA mismatch repair protein Mlh1-like isoform X3 [Periplaneta americana]|uniref:DNA mismatch repair protein Mlh1-like isoform X3 n=1 Tax=Periplaneta americana TaxID=6978 RepID=UPI0037E77380
MVSVRTALKKSFEQMYVPQERQPFIYTSLELDPRNVHPAKHEVHFLHEDSVIDKVRSAVESKLLGCNAARKFYAQIAQVLRTHFHYCMKLQPSLGLSLHRNLTKQCVLKN